MKARYGIVLLLAVVSMFPTLAAGLSNQNISYQGVLTDPSGSPVADGSYSIRFRLYFGAVVEWEETQSVAVAAGRFSVQLGSVVSLLGVDFSLPLNLGIKVGSDPELAPLTPLASVPYAMSARSVWTDPPLTLYYSVSAEDFTPGSDLTSYARNTLSLAPSSGSNVTFAAGANLPNGATITSLQVLFNDLDPIREMTVALRRTNVTTGAFQSVAAVGSGVANSGGQTVGTNTPSGDPLVDNANWAYSLQAFWPTAVGGQMTLNAVRITYTMNQPTP